MEHITGSLRTKGAVWQMVVSYVDDTGKRRQKSKTTGLSSSNYNIASNLLW